MPPALVHLIARSSGFSGADDVESTGEEPRSDHKARLLDLALQDMDRNLEKAGLTTKGTHSGSAFSACSKGGRISSCTSAAL